MSDQPKPTESSPALSPGGGVSPVEFLASYSEAAAALPLMIVEVELLPEVPLPQVFPGSMLRGAFGNALRRTNCPSSQIDGPPCPPDSGCIFCYLFQGGATPQDSFWTRNQTQPPAPFWFFTSPELWRKGRFRLFLVGRAVGMWAPILAALYQACRFGFTNQRIQAEIGEIVSIGLDGQPKGRRADGRIEGDFAPHAVGAAIRHKLDSWPNDRPVALHTLSPLRLLVDQALAPALTTRLLVTNSARRLSALTFHHGPGIPLPPPPPQLLDKAVELETAASRWVRSSIRRLSTRQGRVHSLHGITGRCVFPQLPEEIRFLLAASATVGLGKSVAFGFGQIELNPL